MFKSKNIYFCKAINKHIKFLTYILKSDHQITIRTIIHFFKHEKKMAQKRK